MFNNGILLNGVLIPRLDNNPPASCYFINLEFLLQHTAHFDEKFDQPILVFLVFTSIFFVFLLHFKQYVSMFVLQYYQPIFLLCFCFINLDLSDKQTSHFDLFLITLFVIVVFLQPVLLMCFLQAK